MGYEKHDIESFNVRNIDVDNNVTLTTDIQPIIQELKVGGCGCDYSTNNKTIYGGGRGEEKFTLFQDYGIPVSVFLSAGKCCSVINEGEKPETINSDLFDRLFEQIMHKPSVCKSKNMDRMTEKRITKKRITKRNRK